MKRSLVEALIIGVLVSAVVIALHAVGATLPLERAVIEMLAGNQLPSRVVSVPLQYGLVVFLSLGVSSLVLTSARRQRLTWPLVIFGIELLAIAWICVLYDTFFQPLPSVLAIGLAYGLSSAWKNLGNRSQSRIARDFFGGRLSEDQIHAVTAGDLPFAAEPKTYEVTAVVCDIANKHDLADECPPEQIGEITQRFFRHASDSFLKAGAFLEAVTGEGIVAIFGFPREDAEQAEKATRHALSLVQAFEDLRKKDVGCSKLNVHIGISSGTMILAPLKEDDRVQLLTTGEPVELARRFCIANRFYGSQILIGPRTYEYASKNIVSRPIDFLSGVDVRERHEIYEPLMLAADATPEQIARRDSFWQGVVLYREKRWAEAYSQFQKARGPNDFDDAPLQLYVRRLEPLALNLVESPDR